MGTVPAPYTPTAGDDATQARVLTWADAANYLLGNATSGGSKRPVCKTRQTVAQSLPNATPTRITFDVEDVDYDNGHSTVTNTSRYTAATAGWYHVDYVLVVVGAATGSVRIAHLIVNGLTTAPGTQLQIGPAAAGGAQSLSGSALVFLNVGDFLELEAYQDTGGALNTVVAAPTQSLMCVEWRSN